LFVSDTHRIYCRENLRWRRHQDWMSEIVMKPRGDQPVRSSNCSWSSPVRERKEGGCSGLRVNRELWIWSVGPGCVFSVPSCGLLRTLAADPHSLGGKQWELVLVLVLLLCILVSWVLPRCIGAEYFCEVRLCRNPGCEASVYYARILWALAYLVRVRSPCGD